MPINIQNSQPISFANQQDIIIHGKNVDPKSVLGFANVGGSTVLDLVRDIKPKWYQFALKSELKEKNIKLAESICSSIKNNYGDKTEDMARIHLAKALKSGEKVTLGQYLKVVSLSDISLRNKVNNSLMLNIKALSTGDYCQIVYGTSGERSKVTSMLSAQDLLDNMAFKQPDLDSYKTKLQATHDILFAMNQGVPSVVQDALNNDIDNYISALKDRINLVDMQIESYPTSIGKLINALDKKYEVALDVITELKNKFVLAGSQANANKVDSVFNKFILDTNAYLSKIFGDSFVADKNATSSVRIQNPHKDDQALASKEASKEFASIFSKFAKDIVADCKKEGIKVNAKEIEGMLKSTYIAKLNSDENSWATISKDFQTGYKGKTLDITSEINPVGNFEVSRVLLGGGGISSMDVKTTHTVNLAVTSSTLYDDAKQEVVETFSGFRHGVHSAFGLENDTQRLAANLDRVNEMYIAILEQHNSLYLPAPAGTSAANPILLPITSISLLTPDSIRGGDANEKKFLLEQNAAWRSGQTIALQIPATAGQAARTVHIKPEVLTFNFGVNNGAQGASGTFVGGWGTSTPQNQIALNALRNKSQVTLANLRARVDSTSPEIQFRINTIATLQEQIESLWKSGDYRTKGENPYRLPSRIAMLSYLLEDVPAFNCKSGKDRTGQMDVETKLLATQIYSTGQVPSLERSKDPEDQQLFDIFAINSGNHEMQVYNVGIGGFKTKGVSGLDMSFSPGVKEVQYGQASVVKA